MDSADNELTVRVEDAWVALREVVDRVGVDGLDRSTSAGWTGKEMLSHVAFWLEAFEYVLVSMLRGGETRADYAFGSGYWPDEDKDWPHFDEHNAREAAWARNQEATAVVARLDVARIRHRELLRTLTPEELENPEFVRLVGEEEKHLLEHRPELEELLA